MYVASTYITFCNKLFYVNLNLFIVYLFDVAPHKFFVCSKYGSQEAVAKVQVYLIIRHKQLNSTRNDE